MHSFHDMIEIMDRDRAVDEDWKKWALPVAVAAGSLASAYRAVKYPTKPRADRPAAVEREEAPKKAGEERKSRANK